MNLSQHVTLDEFQNSPTAKAKGIDNSMNAQQIESAKLLCEKVFEPLRAHVGGPIKIASGFRSPALNKAVGGSGSSQHMQGEAMDLNIGAKEFHFIKDNLLFDQLIWEFGSAAEPSWVHVSFSATRNRKQVLRASKVNGKTVYTPFK